MWSASGGSVPACTRTGEEGIGLPAHESAGRAWGFSGNGEMGQGLTGQRSGAGHAVERYPRHRTFDGRGHVRGCAASSHQTATGTAGVSGVDAEALSNTVLFGCMQADALNRLAERAQRRSYGRGEVIFREGDPGDALWVVVEGLVKIYLTSVGGDEMVLITLGRSMVFGELPMVDGGPRSASAAAVSASTLLMLRRTALLEALSESPQLVDSLLQSLGATVRRLTDQAADLVFLDLHGRVAKLLLALADERAAVREGHHVLDLHLTQTDLANMVGGSRQSVNQVLHSFERMGYLALDRGRVIIERPDLLQKRAGYGTFGSR